MIPKINFGRPVIRLQQFLLDQAYVLVEKHNAQ